MNEATIAAIAGSIHAIEEEHPELYSLIAKLAEEFSVTEIDPESGLAEPASELVAAFAD